jgi:hypothetical protein
MSEELAGRTLRAAARRLGILEALIPLWVPEREYVLLSKDERKAHSQRLLAALPDQTTPVELTHSRRQLRKFYRANTRKPVDAYEVSKIPELKALKLPLDACDRQQVALEPADTPGEWLLRVLLPTSRKPQKADWAWHSLEITLPAWAAVRYRDWLACKPVLQITDRGLVRLLLPLERMLPPARALKHATAGLLQARGFALDWGQRRLLTGAVVEPSADEAWMLTSGRQYVFQAGGAQTNLYRTRDHAEHLAARIERIDDLLAHNENTTLRERQQLLLDEKKRQWAHVSERNEQLACASALWAVTHTLAEDCNLIFYEDVDTLEAREHGRTVNGRVNLQVRAQVFERTVELAKLFGIRVIKVPARGTSNRCSRCGAHSRHYHAPDKPRLKPGKRPRANWLICACGRSSDRDHSAAERIGARGLQLYADILAAEALVEAEAQQTGKRDTVKLRTVRERALRGAQDTNTTPKVRVCYTRRSRLSRLPYPQHVGSAPVPSTPIKSSPTKQSGQRSCGAGSPRSVSRGVAVGASQATARPCPKRQGLAMVSLQCRVEMFSGPCRLDGMLLGNRGSVRFTRVRARHLELAGLNLTEETS